MCTIATNFSYLIPIVARHTVGRDRFEPAACWNLGRYGPYLAMIAGLYIMLTFAVLLLPQQSLNYAPICIGIVTVVSLAGVDPPVRSGWDVLVHGAEEDD
ncbi:hypothetical protein VTN00DRAFT_5636 [Thermoascus crustaceus]|uniref:uncharacterized protein n=1 Tax=Thermoascus crustaceus TaxID=5088 RepID=UPI003744A7E1